MGGSNHNSHGLGLVFPKESAFPNMPIAGPDRRFVAMPAYLGGRFDVCGNKWYGSNAANPKKGFPRSCLRSILTQLPNVKKIVCYDIFEEAAKKFLEWEKGELGLDGEVVLDLEAAVKEADVMTVAASRLKPLYVKDD